MAFPFPIMHRAITHHQAFAWTASSDDNHTIALDREYLRSRTNWIRDDLDPLVAQEGPHTLSPNTVITLFTFFDELRKASISYQTFRCSRIHFALLEISGRATRWPGKLIDQVDDLIRHWESQYGPLLNIRPLLYEEGGRLHGISTPEDIERERLLIKWLRSPATHVSPTIARRHGDLGFRPGDWWINAMFAYRAGIIDNGNPAGGVTCDSNEAYALLLTYHDEVSSPSPNTFVYRTKSSDAGRYRLTSALPDARKPIRVLRSHTLRSFWTPRAGVRYEGLYKVTGWTIIYDQKQHVWSYDISFLRVPSDQTPMKEVLRRPTAVEADDYQEYKRIRRDVRLARNSLTRAKPLIKPPDTAMSLPQIKRPSQSHNEKQHLHHRPQSPIKSSKPMHLYTELSIDIPSPIPYLTTSSPTRRSSFSFGVNGKGNEYIEGADDHAARLSVDLTTMGGMRKKSMATDHTMGDDHLGGTGKVLARLGI